MTAQYVFSCIVMQSLLVIHIYEVARVQIMHTKKERRRMIVRMTTKVCAAESVLKCRMPTEVLRFGLQFLGVRQSRSASICHCYHYLEEPPDIVEYQTYSFLTASDVLSSSGCRAVKDCSVVRSSWVRISWSRIRRRRFQILHPRHVAAIL